MNRKSLYMDKLYNNFFVFMVFMNFIPDVRSVTQRVSRFDDFPKWYNPSII